MRLQPGRPPGLTLRHVTRRVGGHRSLFCLPDQHAAISLPARSNALALQLVAPPRLGVLDLAPPARSLLQHGSGDHKELILILARDFASKVATPVFLADGAGQLAFYNNAAERVL